MSDDIEDRLDEQAAGVRRTYQDHIAADVMALAADCLRAATETISRLEADEQEAEHVIAEVERLTAENQQLRDEFAAMWNAESRLKARIGTLTQELAKPCLCCGQGHGRGRDG